MPALALGVARRLRQAEIWPIAPALEIFRLSATMSMPICACWSTAELGALSAVDAGPLGLDLESGSDVRELRSILPGEVGTQKEWITSEASSLISTGSPTGI